MSKLIIILLSLTINYILTQISSDKANPIIPQEIIPGLPLNDLWEEGVFYEYYIDISNYDLDEENIIEIYGKNTEINTYDMDIYLLLTNISDVELIKNNTIKPDIKNKKHKYVIHSKNIKYDVVSKKNYFFLPYKKTEASYNYLIILIKNIFYEIKTYLYTSKRISEINIEQNILNNIFLFNKEIEIRDDIRLYYKINLDNIDLIQNNIYILLSDKNIVLNERGIDVNFYTNFSSLKNYDYNLLVLEKNQFDFSEIFFGIKSKSHYDINNKTTLSIRLDDNYFYYINNKKRINTKLYIDNIKVNRDIFIIENYNTHMAKEQKKYLIIEKLYGNFSLFYYESITDLNFENIDKDNKPDISDVIINLTSLINVYILKCFTPSAFNFEIFSEIEIPEFMPIGLTIKTFLPKKMDFFYDYINLQRLDQFKKYKFQVKILDEDYDFYRTLNLHFHSQGIDKEVDLVEPEKNYTEIFYADDIYYTHYPNFGFGTVNNIFVEYYFTSNKIYTNIAEGNIKLPSRFSSALAFKLNKDLLFDYISLEAKCSEGIHGLYELKLINKDDIEKESNILMVGLPNILMRFSNNIKLTFSNPYDKYVQYEDVFNEDNNYYILLYFNVGSEPVFLNIEYIYNEEINFLPLIKSEMIVPYIEYEILSYKKNFVIKDKVLLNINKCNDKENYILVNYYENNSNIIKETLISESHQIIILDNRYTRTKMILKKESEDNAKKNESTIYPAEYYNKGDILLNYFLIESSIYKELKFTSNFTITYEEEKTWSEIILSWEEYVYRESNDKRIDIATNYSIYILPKNSVVNTICQLYLIPSNKSIVNTTQIKINLEEGEYKIVIIANVINNEMPFEIMYDFIELNIIKKINIVLIVLSSLFGLIAILIILFFFFKQKIISFCKKIKKGKNERYMSINESLTAESEEEDEYEREEEKIKEKNLAEKIMRMINKK